MREEDNRHYTAVRPSLGLIGWEILIVSGMGGFTFCDHMQYHWLYGVATALLIAGILFALITNPLIRKAVFVVIALSVGTFVALLLKIWVDSFIGIIFGILAGIAVFYWHTIAYEVFQFSHKVQQRTIERERYLDVRDEFERL